MFFFFVCLFVMDSCSSLPPSCVVVGVLFRCHCVLIVLPACRPSVFCCSCGRAHPVPLSRLGVQPSWRLHQDAVHCILQGAAPEPDTPLKSRQPRPAPKAVAPVVALLRAVVGRCRIVCCCLLAVCLRVSSCQLSLQGLLCIPHPFLVPPFFGLRRASRSTPCQWWKQTG